MAINTFSSPPAIGATGVTSVINNAALLVHLTGDAYFDAASDISRVDIYYNHTGGRQEKRIIHKPGSTGAFEGTLEFSSFARAGTWSKARVLVYDTDGAIHELTNVVGEDLTI